MNKLSSSKNTPILLAATLVLALLFAVYYYLVLPKKDEVSLKESNVATLQANISSLQAQIAQAEQDQKPNTTIDYYALRKKVPQSRAVDQLLLNIEEIEYVARTRVQSIGFNNYDSLVSASGLQDPNYVPPVENTDPNAQPADQTQTDQTQTDGQTADQQQNQNGEVIVTPVSTITPDQLPAELKMLTLSISVEAKDYDSLLTFIREIEKLERVVRVDTISYTLPGEEATYNPETSKIVTATIQVTTFYYEGEQ